MSVHSKRVAVPLGIAASATLAFGAVAAMQSPLAFADAVSAPSAAVVNGTLFVEGTDGADAITIGLGADPSRFVVDFGAGATSQSFGSASFNAISVSLGAGDDTFAVNPQGQFNDRTLIVSGGSGDDTISGSRGDDLLVGGAGNDTIRGNDGNDLIFSGAGDDNVNGERGTDTELLGAGSDIALWNPGEGNDNIDGGGGHDALTFNGSSADENFAVFAEGSHAILTRNVGRITMDTKRVETLNLATLAGVDNVSVGDLSGTHLRTTNLDLASGGASDRQLDTVSVDGTDQPDHVTVSATDSAVHVNGLHTRTNISGSDSRDQLHVSTGDGNDTVAVSDAAAAQITVSVDLGADQH